MSPTVVVLRQFTFSGSGVFTSFEQKLSVRDLAVATSLPNHYCAFLIVEQESERNVLGGYFFLTDWDHKNLRFDKLLRDTALQIEPCASLYNRANTIKPFQLNRQQDLPDAKDLDIYAATQYALLGTSGSA